MWRIGSENTAQKNNIPQFSRLCRAVGTMANMSKPAVMAQQQIFLLVETALAALHAGVALVWLDLQSSFEARGAPDLIWPEATNFDVPWSQHTKTRSKI
jgi:hypothetical protein